MTEELPEYYFRIRENGAAVFRLTSDLHQQRLEMEQIASITIRNGDVKPHGDRTLTAADQQAIENWVIERRLVLQQQQLADIHRTIEYMNLATHWAQSRASDRELEDVTDPLLIAMHDLRTVLLRKKANRRTKAL